ncbi:MAG TPA: BolA family protein [Candidatus Binatia bacterium]
MDRAAELERRIVEALEAEHVEVLDDSAQHRGHAGARGGAGHYTVIVVSRKLEGLDRVARHRAVYEAAGDMIPKQIHALSVRAYTPEEWQEVPPRG